MNRLSILLLMSVLMTILHPTAMANSSQNVSDEPAGEPSTTEYLPMFEIGKEWRYQLYWPDNPFEETQPNRIRTLKVDETREINGQTYFVVNAYTDEATTPDMNEPYGYFRENISERTVYFRPNKNYGVDPIFHHAFYWSIPNPNLEETEYALYDFNNKQSCNFGYTTQYDLTINIPSTIGLIRGYCFNINEHTYCMAEGIGYIITDADGIPLSETPYDLLGYPPMVAGFGFGQGYVTLLYSVVDGNGNEILSIDGNRLQAGVEPVTVNDNRKVEITVENGEIRITAESPILDVEIFNMQGHSVYRNFFDETTARISTDKFTSGVYMIKACGTARKIIIK